jgi:hypothetical protein
METHWEQEMGNMITSLWGRPIHWEQHATYGDHWEHKMGNMIPSLWGRPFPHNETISLGPSWVSPSAAGFCLSFALK